MTYAGHFMNTGYYSLQYLQITHMNFIHNWTWIYLSIGWCNRFFIYAVVHHSHITLTENQKRKCIKYLRMLCRLKEPKKSNFFFVFCFFLLKLRQDYKMWFPRDVIRQKLTLTSNNAAHTLARNSGGISIRASFMILSLVYG